MTPDVLAPSGRSRARAVGGGQPGLTLVELLVALAVGTLGVSALALLASGVLGAFDADAAAADQQQRARGGIVALVDDLTSAGSGFSGAVEAGPGWGVPALFPDRLRAGAWPVAAGGAVVSALAGRRSEAHARLALPVAVGSTHLDLARPRYCATAVCGFAAGDDIVVFDNHGRVALAEVRAVSGPLALDVVAPLGDAWSTGAMVSAVAATTYFVRPDTSTGLQQIARARGTGPATTLVDFVTKFEVEWRLNGDAPAVRLAPDGTEEGATEGPGPPPTGALAFGAWPAGENCVFSRTGAGAPQSRLLALGPGAVAVPVAALSDGPWCPSPAAATRWDADLIRVADIRVTLRLAVASAHLRAPVATLLGGPARRSTRLVPDLSVTATVRRGRRGQGL